MWIITLEQNLGVLPNFRGDGLSGGAHGLNVLANLFKICCRRRAADDKPHIGAAHCGFGQKRERIAQIIRGDLPRDIQTGLIRSDNRITAFN